MGEIGRDAVQRVAPALEGSQSRERLSASRTSAPEGSPSSRTPRCGPVRVQGQWPPGEPSPHPSHLDRHRGRPRQQAHACEHRPGLAGRAGFGRTAPSAQPAASPRPCVCARWLPPCERPAPQARNARRAQTQGWAPRMSTRRCAPAGTAPALARAGRRFQKVHGPLARPCPMRSPEEELERLCRGCRAARASRHRQGEAPRQSRGTGRVRLGLSARAWAASFGSRSSPARGPKGGAQAISARQGRRRPSRAASRGRGSGPQPTGRW